MPLWGQPWGTKWGAKEDIIISSSSSSSAEPKRYIKLRRTVPSKYVSGRTQGYLVTYEAIEAVGMPLEIFVFQRNPAPLQVGQADVFSNIASPSDLEEYPVNEPAPRGFFFRRSRIDLVFRNLELLRQSLIDIENDVRLLTESLDQMDEFTESEITIDGDYNDAN
jgi:hypothetical protein